MVRLAIAERRELLLAAAWRVMIDQGVAAATTRAICAEAGMPQSSFHYCFDSRADLLKIVVTSRVPSHIERAREAVAQSTNAEDRVQHALAGYWKDVVENPDSHAVLYDITMTSHYDPELRELSRFQYSETQKAARAILEYGISDGRFTWNADLDTLATGLVAFLDGITLRYVVQPDAPGIESALRDYGNYLVTHLIAVPD